MYSEVGQGTVFKVLMPRVSDPLADTVPDVGPPDAMPTGTETLLVVEDEPGLRLLIRECLEGAGYTVLEAADGLAALALHEQHRGPLPLLVTDMVMPGMSGGSWPSACGPPGPTSRCSSRRVIRTTRWCCAARWPPNRGSCRSRSRSTLWPAPCASCWTSAAAAAGPGSAEPAQALSAASSAWPEPSTDGARTSRTRRARAALVKGFSMSEWPSASVPWRPSMSSV